MEERCPNVPPFVTIKCDQKTNSRSSTLITTDIRFFVEYGLEATNAKLNFRASMEFYTVVVRTLCRATIP